MVVPLVDDMIVENRELFSCELSTSDPDVILDPQSATVYIIDDDGKFPSFNLRYRSIILHVHLFSTCTIFIIIVATIQPENSTYMSDERIMSDITIAIIISEGGLEPGAECTVTVHAVDGTAISKLIQ